MKIKLVLKIKIAEEANKGDLLKEQIVEKTIKNKELEAQSVVRDAKLSAQAQLTVALMASAIDRYTLSSNGEAVGLKQRIKCQDAVITDLETNVRALRADAQFNNSCYAARAN
ncbi:hypothetical protein [Piscirickettsia salmonis]|uniref:hypothetical protein n=1 Tax=Piscirickettsia salmonis TaxID=1238 RepID=UPI0012BAF985|nr:hypothetical protein [Piscirickettsia salmonis]